jgi:hypothetical protein
MPTCFSAAHVEICLQLAVLGQFEKARERLGGGIALRGGRRFSNSASFSGSPDGTVLTCTGVALSSATR